MQHPRKTAADNDQLIRGARVLLHFNQILTFMATTSYGHGRLHHDSLLIGRGNRPKKIIKCFKRTPLAEHKKMANRHMDLWGQVYNVEAEHSQ